MPYIGKFKYEIQGKGQLIYNSVEYFGCFFNKNNLFQSTIKYKNQDTLCGSILNLEAHNYCEVNY